QREATGGARGRERRPDAVEIGVGDAASLAGTAVVARRAPTVGHREDGDAADREHALAAEALRHPFLYYLLGTIQRHRRQKLPVGKLGQPQTLAAHPD